MRVKEQKRIKSSSIGHAGLSGARRNFGCIYIIQLCEQIHQFSFKSPNSGSRTLIWWLYKKKNQIVRSPSKSSAAQSLGSYAFSLQADIHPIVYIFSLSTPSFSKTRRRTLDSLLTRKPRSAFIARCGEMYLRQQLHIYVEKRKTGRSGQQCYKMQDKWGVCIRYRVISALS